MWQVFQRTPPASARKIGSQRRTGPRPAGTVRHGSPGSGRRNCGRIKEIEAENATGFGLQSAHRGDEGSPPALGSWPKTPSGDRDGALRRRVGAQPQHGTPARPRPGRDDAASGPIGPTPPRPGTGSSPSRPAPGPAGRDLTTPRRRWADGRGPGLRPGRRSDRDGTAGRVSPRMSSVFGFRALSAPLVRSRDPRRAPRTVETSDIS
jgi:hypothetical protein